STALDLDPRRPEIQYRLSQARALMEASQAVPAQVQAQPPTPPPNRSNNLLDRLKQLKITDEFRDIDKTSEVRLVYRLITSGRVEEALKQGLAALKLQPDNAGLKYQLGLMYKVQGDLDKAIESFQEALKDEPDHTPSLSQLASVFISRNEIQ